MARQFNRGARRKTQWAGMGDATGGAVLPIPVSLTAGTASIISTGAIIGGGAGFVEEEVTLTRTIGNVFAQIAVNAASSGIAIALGLAVARAEAVAAGVASLPSPESDPDFEWVYYTVLMGRNPVAGSSPADNDIWKFQSNFDVKSQRVLRSGQTFVWLAESQSSSGVIGVGGRYLCKLT